MPVDDMSSFGEIVLNFQFMGQKYMRELFHFWITDAEFCPGNVSQNTAFQKTLKINHRIKLPALQLVGEFSESGACSEPFGRVGQLCGQSFFGKNDDLIYEVILQQQIFGWSFDQPTKGGVRVAWANETGFDGSGRRESMDNVSKSAKSDNQNLQDALQCLINRPGIGILR